MSAGYVLRGARSSLRSLRFGFGFGLGLALAGCASSAPRVEPQPTAQPSAIASAPPVDPGPAREPTPDAPFRASAPAPGATPAFTPPRFERYLLRNGLEVNVVERRDLPIVVASYVSRRGGDDVPTASAGLASFTAALLEHGTTTRDALALSDAYAALGATHGATADWNVAGVFVKVLSPNLPAALELLADQVQRPAFAQAEFDQLRGRRLAAVQQESDVPRIIAGNNAARLLYGDAHPYGRSLLGTRGSLEALTRDTVERYYREHLRPEDGALVIVGDVRSMELRPVLQRTFGAWRPARQPRREWQAPTADPPIDASAPRVVLIDRPRAPQSHVLVVQQGPPRSSPDHLPLVVLNAIFGGMFSSRINMNLREAHSYTYGARSEFAFRRSGGPFVVGGAMQTPSTAAAITEIFNELRRVRSTDVSAEELAAAQAYLTETLPARFETAEETVGAIAGIFVHRLPRTEYDTLAERIRAVTVADLRRVAERYLDPDRARVVVVGPRAQVEGPLRELNLGALQVRTPLGEPVE